MTADLRRAAFFGLSRLIGSRVGAAYREWLRLERAGVTEVQDLARQRLVRLLAHAARRVPFYRERAAAPSSPALTDFPILTKTDVREHYLDLMTDELRAQHAAGRRAGRGYAWVEVKTGGSSGVPTTVIHDAAFRDQNRAARLYAQRLCGFPFGTPYFRLWGSMTDINQMRETRGRRLMSRLSGEILLNAFRMGDEDIRGHLRAMRASPVHHMMAYVDAACRIAQFAEENRVADRPALDSIMACAGTLTDDDRRCLQRFFGGRVHNKYGSRECGDMACECEAQGLHIFDPLVLLEAVDEQGKPVPPGSQGRLLVTLLDNFSFPLVRYDIGDRGAVSAPGCACGRPFALLSRLEGRTLEFLTSTDGGYVSPVFIRHLIGVAHNPGGTRRFQVVQETRTEFSVELETDAAPGGALPAAALAAIERDLRRVLGEAATIHVRCVPHIAATASGKFFYTLNKTLRTP